MYRIQFWLWLFRAYRRRRAKKHGIAETRTDRIVEKAYRGVKNFNKAMVMLSLFFTLQFVISLLILVGIVCTFYILFLQIIKLFEG